MYQVARGKSPHSALIHVERVLLRCVDFLVHPWAIAEGARRQRAMRLACAAYRRERPGVTWW